MKSGFINSYPKDSIIFENIVNDFPGQMEISIHLSLFFNPKENRDKVNSLFIDIVLFYKSTPLEAISIYMDFYNKKLSINKNQKDLRKLTSLEVGDPNYASPEYIWSAYLNRDNLNNSDSTIANIQSFIRENNLIENNK